MIFFIVAFRWMNTYVYNNKSTLRRYWFKKCFSVLVKSYRKKNKTFKTGLMTSFILLLWHHGHNNRNWLKQPQIHFYWVIPSKSRNFSLFCCMLCTATPDISSPSENINSTACVSRLSFCFLWLWFYWP